MAHPRVYAAHIRWIELHRIRTTDRSNGFAIWTESSFNGKRTDDGAGERERSSLCTTKVSYRFSIGWTDLERGC